MVPLSILGGLCLGLVWNVPSEGLGPSGVGDVVGDAARTFAWSGVRAVPLTHRFLAEELPILGQKWGGWHGGISAPRPVEAELRRSRSDHAREEANTLPGANLASPSPVGQAQALALGEERAAGTLASPSPLVVGESQA